jgi:glycyl-tRNA synthetase alpha subunit
MDGMEITQFTYFQQVQLTKSVHFFMTPAQITLGLDHTAV